MAEKAPREAETVTLRISGLHCDGCATNVETVLRRAPGVREATVSYEEREGTVRYDPRATSVDDILGLEVFQLGTYRAEVVEDRDG